LKCSEKSKAGSGSMDFSKGGATATLFKTLNLSSLKNKNKQTLLPYYFYYGI